MIALESRVMLAGDAAVAFSDAVVNSPPAASDASQVMVAGVGLTAGPQGFSCHSSPRGMAASSAAVVPSIHSKSIVFIDSAVDDIATLESGLIAGAELVLIDSSRDGIRQVTDHLRGRSGVRSIHLVAHGHRGQLQLGNQIVDSIALQQSAAAISTWQSCMVPGADILVYGCETGAGQSGAMFAFNLARLTGADVALSDDQTGSIDGSDWQLERVVGEVDAPIAFQQQSRRSYLGVLSLAKLSEQPASVIDPDQQSELPAMSTQREAIDDPGQQPVSEGSVHLGLRDRVEPLGREDRQLDLAELDLAKLDVAELDVSELGVSELNVAERDVVKIGSGKMDLAKMSVPDLNLPAVGASESSSEISVAKDNLLPLAIAEETATESGVSPVLDDPIAAAPTDVLSPTIVNPSASSLVESSESPGKVQRELVASLPSISAASQSDSLRGSAIAAMQSSMRNGFRSSSLVARLEAVGPMNQTLAMETISVAIEALPADETMQQEVSGDVTNDFRQLRDATSLGSRLRLKSELVGASETSPRAAVKTAEFEQPSVEEALVFTAVHGEQENPLGPTTRLLTPRFSSHLTQVPDDSGFARWAELNDAAKHFGEGEPSRNQAVGSREVALRQGDEDASGARMTRAISAAVVSNVNGLLPSLGEVVHREVAETVPVASPLPTDANSHVENVSNVDSDSVDPRIGIGYETIETTRASTSIVLVGLDDSMESNRYWLDLMVDPSSQAGKSRSAHGQVMTVSYLNPISDVTSK